MNKKHSIKINNIVYNEDQINEAMSRINKLVVEKNFKKRLVKFINVITFSKCKFYLDIAKCDLDSFTDGLKIQLSLSNEFLFYNDPLVYTAFCALAMHETEHVLSSDFDSIKPFVKKCYKEIFESMKLAENISNHYSKYIFNAIEDGRIERMAVNRSPGCMLSLQWMRYVSWYNSTVSNYQFNDKSINSDDKEKMINISTVLWAVCSYATIGLLPNEWEKRYAENSEETKLINSCKNIIDKAVNSNFASDCFDASFEVVNILKDYLFKNTNNIDDELLKNLLQNQMSSSDNHEESNESRENKDSNSNSIGSNQSIRMNGNSDNSKNSDTNEEDDTKDNKKDDSKSNFKDGKEDEEKSSNSNKPSSNKNDKESSESKNSSKSNNKDSENTKPYYETDMLNIDDVLNSINDIEDDIKDKAEKELKETVMSEPIRKGNTKTFKTKEEVEVSIDKLNELGEKKEYLFPFTILYDNDLKSNIKIASDLQLDAKTLRSKLKPIFESIKPVYKKNRLNGSLDVTKLTRLKTKERDLFKSKNDLKNPSVAISILIDGSGSMRGFKAHQALNIASTIENAVNGYTKLRIDIFDTEYRETRLNIIKNFNDENYIGYCEKFKIKNDFFCSGNRDGLAIRLSTEALLKREEETKILFVISDGIPSSYCQGYESGIEDVKSAVHLSTKKGIKVFGIYIDSGDDSIKGDYKYMYGQRRAIICEPEDMKIILPRIIKQQIF